jgi:hypothetical protein
MAPNESSTGEKGPGSHIILGSIPGWELSRKDVAWAEPVGWISKALQLDATS